MFRPENTPEMKTLWKNGAKNGLRSIVKYVLSVAYSDTRRFSYDEEGKISLNFGHEKITPNTVVVWGGISSHPKASLCRGTGRFDSSTYTNILQQHIIPLAKKDPSKTTGLVHD
ncbi:uncharacterized protein LOC116924485 isoform X2 [Daphnia magna]|uniref:Uncharacterized protein n=1 Tax=Daphnia magna TaxID=35525 RepID=A0ABQ9ZWJ3_9CRUS|nr:uncharacterized protein LOC116924485 isoform X2 [Daphnia magna]KAK4017278.1 hypothetical protein OUZ56_032225 [Daphnia magna]